VRRIVALVLIAHGTGPVASIIPMFGDTPEDLRTGSWLPDRRFGVRVASAIGITAVPVPDQAIIIPPSATMVWPVVYEDASESR